MCIKDKKMKIINYRKAKDIIEYLKATHKTVIFKSGCFDTIHIGHVKMLQIAKSLSDILIVGVGTDESISKYKRKPLFDQNNRAELLAGLECVDYVVILEEPMLNSIDHREFLTLTKPTYYYLPHDDKVLKEKQKMADELGIIIRYDDNIKIKNYTMVIEPHSTDILNAKLLNANIEEIYPNDFKILREVGNLTEDWANVYEHCKMEGNLAMIVARLLDLSNKDTALLIRAAILHDWYKRNERESQDYNSDYSRVELQKLGIESTIVDIAHSVGHTSLKTIEKSTLLCKIMHFIDDITYGSEIMEIEERVNLTQGSNRYTKLAEESRKDFDGQTFFDVQKSVGIKVQNEIEKVAGIKLGSIVPIIKEKYKLIISEKYKLN
jgi:cytidyltransferase-like protein